MIARDTDLTDTDPDTAECDTCQIVFSATYQTLVGLVNNNKTLIPDLASSWTCDANETVYTFKLNPDAKFSDGSPVTSADVKFSHLRLKYLQGSPSYLVETVNKITTPNALTAVVTLNAPDSEFPNAMSATYTSIINAKVAMAHGASDASNAIKTDTAEHWFQSNSAGSGPYELKSFTSGSQVTLVANPKYWLKHPYYKKIVIEQATSTRRWLAPLRLSGTTTSSCAVSG